MHSEECMGRLRNIALRDYQKSMTTRQTHGQTDGWADRQTPDKVIPMCRYASQYFACICLDNYPPYQSVDLHTVLFTKIFEITVRIIESITALGKGQGNPI